MTEPNQVDAPGPRRTGLRAALSEHTVPAGGLLPLRVFLGVTYLYAGIDKFVDPHFLAAGDPLNVAAQLAGYARSSPLAPLITAAVPMAIQIGLLIALAEIAIGLGLLTGLAYRLAAGAGAALSLLFWLTASWTSTPYFFSPDLPYAAGFLTLALVGHGGLWVLGAPRAEPSGEAPPASAGRRAVLQVAVLAVLTLGAAALAAALRVLGPGTAGGGAEAGPVVTSAPATPAPTSSPTVPPTAVPTAAASATAAPTATAAAPTPTAAAVTAAPGSAGPPAAGPVIGTLADFTGGNGLPFTIPYEAPTELNPGGPGIMVKLADGSVVAYSATCTHGRCTVGWDATTSIIQCPCHTARFDPAQGAQVLSGPAQGPLPAVPVAVDGSGQIHVTATG